MHIASLTDYSTSKVAKIVVTHKILSVRAEGYKFPNSHQLQKSQRESFFFFFVSGNASEVSLLGSEVAGSTT